MRGRKRSSAKRVAPVTFEVASTFLSARPTTRSSEGRRSVAVFLLVPIQALRRGARVLATHPRHLDWLFVHLESNRRLGVVHGDDRNLDKRQGRRQLSCPNSHGGAAMKTARRLSGWTVGGIVVLLAVYPPNRLAAQDYRARAIAILRSVPLIDGHNDIPDAIRGRGGLDSVNFAVNQPKLMSDIPKLRAGAVGAQFWAAYVPVTTLDSGPHPAVYALEQIDLIKRLCAKYSGDLAMAYSAADVERNFKRGKISCLIGIEGGHAIENSLGVLRIVAAVGVRYITLTHWRSLGAATASTDRTPTGL